MKKPDIVQVTRYYRPTDKHTGNIASNKGITVNFEINYPAKQFTARWAVCNGDNFNKTTGVTLAAALPESKAIVGAYDTQYSLFDNLAGVLFRTIDSNISHSRLLSMVISCVR